jgi:hypothetical protein
MSTPVSMGVSARRREKRRDDAKNDAIDNRLLS